MLVGKGNALERTQWITLGNVLYLTSGRQYWNSYCLLGYEEKFGRHDVLAWYIYLQRKNVKNSYIVLKSVGCTGILSPV